MKKYNNIILAIIPVICYGIILILVFTKSPMALDNIGKYFVWFLFLVGGITFGIVAKKYLNN